MSGTTPRLGLKTYDESDPFLRQDFNDNSARLDAYPGAFICTSTSRPAWGAAQTGMRIYETDTRRELVWTGTGWRELLDAPAVWSGAMRPNASVGRDAHLYYKLSTFNVRRPGALLVLLFAEVAIRSIYVMNVNVRAQLDGSDVGLGDSAPYERHELVHSSGNGYGRYFMVPAMGIRTVNPGSHNIGVHFYTTPDGASTNGSATLVSARAVALMVNSTDT
ncbi:hypothetical protein ACPCSE_29625 [Streptomyces cellulosae]